MKKTKDLYEIGEIPPIGIIPKYMHAWVIRSNMFGKPSEAFKKEIIARRNEQNDQSRDGYHNI